MHAFALHPTRLAGAVAATAAIAVAIALTAVCANAAGIQAGLLPQVLGGLFALNALLFFPPGALTDVPRRALPMLAVNLVPMPLTVLLFHIAPPLADLALIASAAAAMLARGVGPIAGALGFVATINVVAALVLGAAPALYLLGPIAGVVATGVGVIADHAATRLQRGIGERAEQLLLADAVALFLDDLARYLRDAAPWPARWYVAHHDRVRAVTADIVMALPPALIRPARAPDHFIGAIAACADGLRSARLPSLVTAAADATAGIAAAMRDRDGERGIALAQALLDQAGAAASNGDAAAGGQALGLALLLKDFVPAVLATTNEPIVIAPAGSGGRPGRAEFRLALQVSVSLALAIIASQMIAGPKPYWIPLTALIVSCASFGESLLKSLERALGTILGLLVGQLAWILLRDRPDSMIGVIAAAVFGMFFCRIGPYRWILFWLTLALSGLLHLADVGAAFYLARLRDTGTGAVIALVVCRVVLPMRTADAAQARRREYLDAIAGQLRNFAAALRQPSATAPAALFDDTAARALAALHALADAEMVEAAVDRAVRLAVRRRLAAADRIARCLVSLQSILPLLRAAPDPVAAGFVADVAEAASGRGPPTDGEAIGSRTQAMLATRAGASAQVEQLAAELRLFRLLSAISEAVTVLREDLNRRP